jgi:DNA-binding PadR family transcriptional regulator
MTDEDGAASLSELEVGLLGLVSIRPMYGYEIGHHFDRALSPFWTVPRTQIYPKLRGLEKRGLVVSTRVQQDAKPNRRVYEITDAGRARLLEWMRGAINWPEMKHFLLAKLFLGNLLPSEEMLELLREYRDRITEMGDELREIHSKFEPALGGEYRKSAFFQILSLEHLIAMTDLEVSGSARAIEEIEEAKPSLERRDGPGSEELIDIVRDHFTIDRDREGA